MSDNRLGYSRGLLDQLRASHAHLSPEELLDLVCHLTKTYVLDQTIPFDIPLPERAEELSEAALAEVQRFLDEPPTAEEIASEQEKNRRDREERVRSNGFWSGAILGTVMRGEDPLELLAWDERNDTLSSEEVHAAAVQVFDKNVGFVKVTMLPLEDAPESE